MTGTVELEESLRGRRIALEEIPVIDFGPFLTGDLAQRKAVAEKIGHDKRGNVIYRRTEDGEDALVSRVETVTEIDQETGGEVLREITVTERQIDDELPEVATAYLRWLSEQR